LGGYGILQVFFCFFYQFIALGVDGVLRLEKLLAHCHPFGVKSLKGLTQKNIEKGAV